MQWFSIKFTRGGWGTSEQNHAGEDLIRERQMENRVYTFSDDEKTLPIDIKNGL